MRHLHTVFIVSLSLTTATKLNAGLAQLVERHVANVIVRSSNLLSRSKYYLRLVKWYHSAFGTQERKFDSFIGDQVYYLRKTYEQNA